MNKQRIKNLKSLLEELVPEQINYQTYNDELEDRWATDAFIRGRVLALQSYLKLLSMNDLYTSLCDFVPIDGNAFDALTFISCHITPEVLNRIENADVSEDNHEFHFWDILHPRIVAIAKPRFDAEFYSDSVEAAFKEVNVIVKKHFKQEINTELDGAKLMTRAFSKENPVIPLADTSTVDGMNIQQGYMHLFQGAILGIRNPSAHGNHEMERVDAIHSLFLSSLLLRKFDARIQQ
ncbi:TIGR02391 family protein [Desulfocicer niacini]